MVRGVNNRVVQDSRLSVAINHRYIRVAIGIITQAVFWPFHSSARVNVQPERPLLRQTQLDVLVAMARSAVIVPSTHKFGRMTQLSLISSDELMPSQAIQHARLDKGSIPDGRP